MDPIPDRLKKLPTDERGYPVPWFVAWVDGKPEFRAADARKFVRAIKEKLCWVCGGGLGVHVVFVAGPMCGINRTSSEPPSHYDCAKWSALNCPFLSNPRMVRREGDGVDSQQLRDESAGFALTRNPGAAMLWITRTFEVFKPHVGGTGKYLITMGEPERVEWYAEGKEATRAQVLASIESGIANLEALAAMEPGGLEFLAKQQQRFARFIPAETSNPSAAGADHKDNPAPTEES